MSTRARAALFDLFSGAGGAELVLRHMTAKLSGAPVQSTVLPGEPGRLTAKDQRTIVNRIDAADGKPFKGVRKVK